LPFSFFIPIAGHTLYNCPMPENELNSPSAPELNIGLIGFGWIGKVHAAAYHSLPFAFPRPAVRVRLCAVLRNDPVQDLDFIHSLGVDLVTSSVEEFYAQPLDAVDICSPNLYHREQVLEALRRQKHVCCEKPLGRTLADARAIAAGARSGRLITHTAFNRRYVPAVRHMQALIADGGIGQPFHFRAHMHYGAFSDPALPVSWRLRRAVSGGGALADLGIHLIDLVRFLLGDAAWVQCQTRTFIARRPAQAGSSRMETVDVDDWALCQLGLRSGAVGSLEVTRLYGGAQDSTLIEVIGSRGTLRLDFAHLDRVEYYDLNRKHWRVGPQDFQTPSGLRPIAELWPPAKYSQGFYLDSHLASCYDFLQCVQENKPSPLNFETALAAQEILEAAYLSASRSAERVDLPLD